MQIIVPNKLTEYLAVAVFSILTSALLIVFAKPAVVNALINDNSNLTYDVDTKESEDGFSQIILKDSNGKVTFITNSKFPNANPKMDGKKVVWMGQDGSKWQIYQYNLNTQKTIKITTEGNNVNPKILGNRITWEGNINGTWQVFYFDGVKIRQLTKGTKPKQDVTIYKNEIAYSQKDETGWNVYVHTISENKTVKLTSLDNNRKPEISGPVILWDYSNDNEIGYKKFDKTSKKVEKFISKSGLEFVQPSGSATQLLENTATAESIPATEEAIKKELNLIPQDTTEIVNLEDVIESTQSSEIPKDTKESTQSL